MTKNAETRNVCTRSFYYLPFAAGTLTDNTTQITRNPAASFSSTMRIFETIKAFAEKKNATFATRDGMHKAHSIWVDDGRSGSDGWSRIRLRADMHSNDDDCLPNTIWVRANMWEWDTQPTASCHSRVIFLIFRASSSSSKKAAPSRCYYSFHSKYQIIMFNFSRSFPFIVKVEHSRISFIKCDFSLHCCCDNMQTCPQHPQEISHNFARRIYLFINSGESDSVNTHATKLNKNELVCASWRERSKSSRGDAKKIRCEWAPEGGRDGSGMRKKMGAAFRRIGYAVLNAGGRWRWKMKMQMTTSCTVPMVFIMTIKNNAQSHDTHMDHANSLAHAGKLMCHYRYWEVVW